MSLEAPFAAVGAALAFVLAIAATVRSSRSPAVWCFVVGMLLLGVEAAALALSLTVATGLAQQEVLQGAIILVRAFAFAAWVLFVLLYSRGDVRRSLRFWALPLVIAVLLPLALAFFLPRNLISMAQREDGVLWLFYSPAAKILNGLLLFESIAILMNLERTFRAAVGTMQWRIKFTILGLAVIFGARFYTTSQALLYSGHALSLQDVDVASLIIGATLIGVGYLRAGLSEIDVYPSTAVLHTSLTILLIGGYLLIIGVFAQVIARTGKAGLFQVQAFLVLLALAAMGVALLSRRWRQKFRNFVSRHFRRSQYDSHKIWTAFTRATSHATNERELGEAVAQLVSVTFNAMSVRVWLFSDERQHLTLVGSTAGSVPEGPILELTPEELMPLVRERVLDLDRTRLPVAGKIRLLNTAQFVSGGDRYLFPLIANERCLGLLFLADRVAGMEYNPEEFELLKCVADQTASTVLNLQLGKELLLAKELEAFQTISAFFVHDMKNAASTLRLMLQNLPIHFDDPEFRADALRGIGETAARINQIIERLSAVRSRMEMRAGEVDLNALVKAAVAQANNGTTINFHENLGQVPPVMGDPEQLQSVVTNLVLNARDAVNVREGSVEVSTEKQDGCGILTVTDNGCGMSPAFMKDSLFRPFKTTKKKGLGIGMFHTKTIIQAHRGTIRVKSGVGEGTTFQVRLPLAPE